MTEPRRAESGRRPMPTVFVAAPTPFSLDDREFVAKLGQWAEAMPRPDSILMFSAHWERRPITIGPDRPVPLLYDFYGFPARYYRQKYPAPGAPALAARVRQLLEKTRSVDQDPQRGLDHGAYVPLVAMYPGAEIPVLQVSLPTMDARQLFELGRTLAPLRREGVLIMCSGVLIHNIGEVDLSPDAMTPAWATEFDSWIADVLQRRDKEALLDYVRRAPNVQRALPTHEHFVPVIIAMGAATGNPGSVRFPISGFFAGTHTVRSVQFG